jgi:poly(A) polymerase
VPPPSDSPALVRLWNALPGARLVGGAVRDRLAGIDVVDHDLATPDPPESVMHTLADIGIRTVPTGLAHGTVTAILDGVPFEITTLRRDVRTDGRHAETAWTDDWQADAARRDFTINAMSLDRAGVLHDYFGGRDDLVAGRVRFVGEAARRIEEDHLRILRFFRFQARYGRGSPDPDAARAIGENASLITRLSAERVWSELKRLLAAPRPADAVRLMEQFDVLRFAVPEGADPARLEAGEAIGMPADPILRTAMLLTGDAAAFAARLRLSGQDAERLVRLRATPPPDPGADPDEIRRRLADTDNELLAGASWLAEAARPDAYPPQAWSALRDAIAATPRPIFPLAGRDAIALGQKPGPAVGEALAAVRAWWLERGARDGAAECRSELARQLSAPGPNC